MLLKSVFFGGDMLTASIKKTRMNRVRTLSTAGCLFEIAFTEKSLNEGKFKR
jgi:hypothetical protein|tara:strand:+ start:360 stop:515 length:156 start_codon:yes stop_codon:yes gene_type:complete